MRGWKIRFDAPPERGLTQCTEGGDILALFRAWNDAWPNERRESRRYTPAETHAWIGWWHGSRFLVTHAELINLSKGGALVEVDDRPPSSQPVWICLGAPHPIEHVQARVLDATLRPSGDYTARLEFYCAPASFFLAAGYESEVPRSRPIADGDLGPEA